MLCSLLIFVSEGTGTKVVYGDYRRYLPVKHPWRKHRDFGAPEKRLSPPLREDRAVREEALAVSSARDTFGIAHGSVFDPSRGSGLLGKSQLHRAENLDVVLAAPTEFMHVLVSRSALFPALLLCQPS